ncbi:hypothetical protein [Streptomyces sp. NPDC050704]|uniref:hypothetical protein n=1 Tax=Streptomyces sp. NPDC050704 TaxID=3157219 RepID=UPI0034242F55
MATLLLGALGVVFSGWIETLPGELVSPESARDRVRFGPDFSVSTDTMLLDDEGTSMVTRGDYRPSREVLRFMSRPGAAATEEFGDVIRSNGGVKVQDVTLRITLTGHRNQGINILDIRPHIVKREAPWSGTYFRSPSEAGSPTMSMMFDMDRPFPVAREVEFNGGESPVPGKPFFSQRTITLRDNEQQVVLVRVTTARYYVAFKLDVTYMLGHEEKKTVIDDDGKPFQVSAPLDMRGTKVPYRRFFERRSDFSLCQLKPVAPAVDGRRCRNAYE